MCVIVHSSSIDHDQAGHIEGTGLWSRSIRQGGLNASSSNIDGDKLIWSVMSTENTLGNFAEGLTVAFRGGVALYSS